MSINLQEKKKISLIRQEIIEINYLKKAAHLGSCLSCVEMLYASFKYLKPNFENLIFSKGHAALAYYATLKHFNKKLLAHNYLKIGGQYWAHITKDLNNKIYYSFGSLGYGLGITAGMAYGNKKKKYICILSDGELNEGSIWESFWFLSHYKLNNISVLIDMNNLQSFGKTKEILDINYYKIIKSLNINIYNINGHDYKKIFKILSIKTIFPKVIFCNTIKGKGVESIENKISSHYFPASKKDLKIFKKKNEK